MGFLGLKREKRRTTRPRIINTARPSTSITWVGLPVCQKLVRYCWTAPSADWSTGSSKIGVGVAVGCGVGVAVIALGVAVDVIFVLTCPFAGFGAGVGLVAGTGLQLTLCGLAAARQTP